MSLWALVLSAATAALAAPLQTATLQTATLQTATLQTATLQTATLQTAQPQDPASRLSGERITWSLHYAGIAAGSAWAQALAADDGTLVIEGGAVNAPWYGKLYSIDDHVRSTWDPTGGSRRYQTQFREGGFQQDQDMRLAARPVTVWRKQHIDGQWQESTRSYDATADAEDPISAVTRVRLLEDHDATTTPLGQGWTFPVFSGDKSWPLIVVLTDHDTIRNDVLGTVPVRVVELRTQHKGMLEQRGRFRIWLTDDPHRIPVRMVVKTNFGAIRAELSAYQPPAAQIMPAGAEPVIQATPGP